MGSKKYLVFGVALGMVAGLLFLTACGGGGLPAAPAAPAIRVTPAPVPPSTTPRGAAPVATPPSTQDPLVAKGEEVFQRTAGGVGCQACHGRDAKSLVGPAIRGATVSRVSSALSNVEQMAFIRLSPEEVQAVAAYLQFLATQP